MRGHWPHLLLVVLLLLGIAGFTQAIAERHSVRFDLTPGKAYSLAEQTVKVLSQLSRGPIDVTVYYRRESLQDVSDLMGLFKGAAPSFRYELLDLDRYPGRARQDGIDRYDKAVIRYGTEKVVVDTEGEQSIAGGLLRLARGRPVVVRFLEGHGERDLADVSGPTGYGELRQVLMQESYVVEGVNVMGRGEVPPDTDLLVIAGPKNDLLDGEAAAVDLYLDSGGHVLVMIDPVPLPNVDRLVAGHGVATSLDVILDSSNKMMGTDPFTIRIPAFFPHGITGAATTPALLAVARSVEAAQKPDATISPIAQTYPEAWAMRDFERAGNPRTVPREPEDRRGPISVMAAASWPAGEKGEARLVVVGDSDFAANGFLRLLGNRDLVLNAMSWLVSAEALIAAHKGSEISALRPLSPMILSGRQGQAIFFFTVIIQPAVILGAGAAIALRKRWRG